MFASSLAKGFYDRGEQRNRQRRDIATAFNEFKQANPEATAADFQSFIDAQVGNGLGSNYLRGGAPSKQVLGAIASDNLRNKNRRIQEETRKDIMAQGDLSGYLSGQMDKFLLDADPDKLEDAKKEFLAGLSPEARSAVDSSGTLNQWTEKRYKFLQGQRMINQLPQIQRYLEQNNYNLAQVTPEAMGEFFGIPTSAAKGFVTTAQQIVARHEDVWWRQHNSELTAVAEKAASLEGANKSSITKAIQSHLDAKANAGQGISKPSIANYSGLIDGLATDTVERQRKTQDARSVASGQRMAKFSLAVKENQGLMNFINNSNEAEAIKRLKEIMQIELTDEDVKTLFNRDSLDKIEDSDVKGLLAEEVTRMRNLQDGNYAQQYGTVEQQISGLEASFVQDNKEKMFNALKTAGVDDQAGQIAQIIGQDYYATQDLLTNIVNISNALPEDVKKAAADNPNVAIEYIKTELAKLPSTIPMTNALQAQKGMMTEKSNLYAPQTFEDFITSETEQTATFMGNMDLDYNQAISQFADNPEGLIQALNMVQSGMMQFQNELNMEMEGRSRNKLSWVYANSGGYNPAVVKKEVTDPAASRIENLTKLIQEQITKAEEAIKVRDALPPEGNGPTVLPNADPEKSDFNIDMEGLDARATRLAGLRSVAKDNFTFLPYFNLSEEESQKQEIVREFLGGYLENSAYFRYMLEQATQEEYDKFAQDPLAFITSSEQGQEFLKSYNNGEFANLIPNQ